ncbi:hypothetical protein DRP04_00795 [Archaeoglobales archaeon]|mgnify:CR=1 FL=1|nr:MAG: hypothetical protein DRP04_00795 [Archaeoglobales archaeon]
MASVVVTGDESTKEVFETPYDKIGKITFIEVDNQSASAVTITVQDVFTPFATDETTSPSEVTKNRKQFTVGAGEEKSWQDKTKSIEILGTCKLAFSTTSSDIKVTVGYDFE